MPPFRCPHKYQKLLNSYFYPKLLGPSDYSFFWSWVPSAVTEFFLKNKKLNPDGFSLMKCSSMQGWALHYCKGVSRRLKCPMLWSNPMKLQVRDYLQIGRVCPYGDRSANFGTQLKDVEKLESSQWRATKMARMLRPIILKHKLRKLSTLKTFSLQGQCRPWTRAWRGCAIPILGGFQDKSRWICGWVLWTLVIVSLQAGWTIRGLLQPMFLWLNENICLLMVTEALAPLSKTAESAVLEAATGVMQTKLLDTKILENAGVRSGSQGSQHGHVAATTSLCCAWGHIETSRKVHSSLWKLKKCILRLRFVRSFAILMSVFLLFN